MSDRLRGKKYSGDLLVRKYGSDEGFEKLGNITELSTKKDSDSEELKSTGRNDWGEAIEVESKAGATDISIKFNTFNKKTLAKVLMGEDVDLSAEPQTFTDVAIKVGTDWLPIGYDDIDMENFALADDKGSAIAKETYEVNPRLGMIRFKEASKLKAGSTIKATGKTKGSKGYQIEANTLASIPLEMKLDGRDRITGKNGVLDMPHAVLSADGDINWLDDKWWEAGLSGKLVKDEGKPTMLFKEYH